MGDQYHEAPEPFYTLSGLEPSTAGEPYNHQPIATPGVSTDGQLSIAGAGLVQNLFGEVPVHLTNPGYLATDSLPRVSSLPPMFNGKTIPSFQFTALYIPTSDHEYHRAKYEFMLRKFRDWIPASSELQKEIAWPGFTLELLRRGTKALEDFLRNVRNVPGYITKRQDNGDIKIEVLEVKVRVNNFISWLGGLDFHPLGGGITAFAHSAYPDSMVSFNDYPLFAREGTVYFLRRSSAPSVNKLMSLTRQERNLPGHEKSDREWFKRPELLDILMHVKQLFRADHNPKTPPFLVVDLGELYTHTPTPLYPAPEALATKFHVLMEVTRWEKPLWLAYSYEYYDQDNVLRWRGLEPEGAPPPPLLPGVPPFDLACITHDLDNFGAHANATENDNNNGARRYRFPAPHLDGAEVGRAAAQSGSIARPVFAEPDYYACMESLRYAWTPESLWPENVRQWGDAGGDVDAGVGGAAA